MALSGREPVIGEAPPDANISWQWHQGRYETVKNGEYEFQLEVSYEDEEEIITPEKEFLVDQELKSDDSKVQDSKAVFEIGDGDEMGQVQLEDVTFLLDRFAKAAYRAKCESKEEIDILQKCLLLFSTDYHLSVINNTGGELSSHYPSSIVILEYEKSGSAGLNNNRSKDVEEDSLYQSLYDPSKLYDLCQKARLARCRARFPVPVILVDGKRICRSSTLSGGPEIYGRSSYDFFFAGKSGSVRECDEDDEEEDLQDPSPSSDWQLFDRVRSQDIKLLKTFNVTHICDLMVEKKKVKFGMNITSSEKVDKENRYSDFTILSLPYPGCEFFQEYSSNSYNGHGLIYAWNQTFIDARLVIPNDCASSHLEIDWNSYKSWDIIKLTQNYLKLLLKYIKNGSTGLLVHCISGWDRTPLFISLLRLSLWADGEAHKSLKPLEILYLTLAYDWFLFGHNLADRLGKREEILFFCFDVLKYITSDDYAFRKGRHRIRKMSEMEPLIDDLLIDSGNVLGSNTSLNSSCSSVSTHSQECPPLFFQTTWNDSSDEAVVAPSCGDCVVVRHVRASTDEVITAASNQRSSTTPVAVPVLHTAKRSDSSSSCGCGSWQIISGTGSLRGSTSTRDSLSSQTPNSDHSCHSRHSRCSIGWNETVDPENCHRTARHLMPSRASQLNEVRKAFLTVYQSSNVFRYRNGVDAATGGSGIGVSGGGLSSLLDHFAEKVGIRTGRGTQ